MNNNNTVTSLKQKIADGLYEMYTPSEIEFITKQLLEGVGYSPTDLILNTQIEVQQSVVDKINTAIDQLKNSRPLQYVLGYVDFYTLSLQVDENVLIPRPETEELVDWIIKDKRHLEDLKVLDIGTGSGCIALCLKKHLRNAYVEAWDISLGALHLAQQNARRLNLDVRFNAINILAIDNLPQQNWDIIVSNPPYITSSEQSEMQSQVLNYEPHNALFVTNNDPLQFYKAIAHYAENNLTATGSVYAELNALFAVETQEYYENKNWKTVLKNDMQGKPRMLKAVKTNLTL